MDILVRQEIYIPKDAEVKNISLRTLPNSVLNRMGLSGKDADGSSKLADSAVGVWICPAILRPKGQRQPLDTGSGLLENMSSKIAKDCRASPGRLPMSFVSSNKEAHKVLEETLQGHSVSADTPSAGVLPPDSAPHTYQVAVVIYQGRVYLSIKKPRRRKPQGETPDPQPETKTVQATPPMPDTTTSNQKKRPTNKTSLKPSTKPPQKRLRIKLPSKPLKLPSNLLKRPASAATTTAPSKAPSTAITAAPASTPTTPTSAQKLLHVKAGGTGRSQTKSNETHRENGKDEPNAIRGSVSSPLTTAPPPQTSDGAHIPANAEAAERQAAEETADWFQQQNNDSGIQELDGGDPQSPARSVYMNADLQRNANAWTGSRAWGSASSPQQECDFTELEEEERIAQVKARLRQSEAALRNMKSL